MDTRTKYQTLIKNVLSEYAKYKPAYGEIDSRVTFDDEHGSYALLQVGWEGDEYVHGAVIHRPPDHPPTLGETALLLRFSGENHQKICVYPANPCPLILSPTDC